MAGFRTRSETVIHEWAKWSLVEGQFVDPDGGSFSRTFVRSPGAVGIVAIEGSEPDVLLVRQYRPALDRETLEIPAGMRDVENEDPLVTAQRELQEEVGRIALHWTLLGTHVSAPGISNSHVTLFLAEGLSEVPIDRHGPEEHHMVVERHPLASVVARARDGDLGDAKTVIGVMLADAILRER